MKKIFTLFTMAVMAIATASAGVVRTTLIKTDFSDNQAIGGWGGTVDAANGVCTLTHVGIGEHSYDAQACINATPTIPAETKVTLVIKAKASAAYNLGIDLQKSQGYQGRGNFEAIPLTTDFQTFTRTCTANGEGTDRVLLNFGDFDGTITIDELEVYYEEESAADDYMLKVTTSAMKDPWDSQVLINIPEALKTGVKYEIKFFVKGSEAASELGSVIENNSVGADKRDSNKNSTELQYPATFPVTTSWAEVSIGESDGKYAYDRLLLNIGKFDGTLYFDNFRFINKTDNSEILVDFKDGISGKAEKRSWHSHVSIERAASDCPTDVKLETEAAKQNSQMYSISGYQVGKSAKGIVIMNGKKYSKK